MIEADDWSLQAFEFAQPEQEQSPDAYVIAAGGGMLEALLAEGLVL